MTGSHLLTGFIVPADERIQTGKYTETFHNLTKRADVKFPEIVRTEYLNHYDSSVMLVDGYGHARNLKVNRRAQFLSGYSLASPIVGDVLFLGETMGAEGAELLSLTDRALEQYFQNSEVHSGFGEWLCSEPVKEFSERHGLINPHHKVTPRPIKDNPQA